MKKESELKKMLEGYIVGRPLSRNRKYNDNVIYLQSDYGVMTVFIVNNQTGFIETTQKKFYNSWFDAFKYYYNECETIINNSSLA